MEKKYKHNRREMIGDHRNERRTRMRQPSEPVVNLSTEFAALQIETASAHLIYPE